MGSGTHGRHSDPPQLPDSLREMARSLTDAQAGRWAGLTARERAMPFDVEAGQIKVIVLNLGNIKVSNSFVNWVAVNQVTNSPYLDVLRDAGYTLRFGPGVPVWHQNLSQFASGPTVTNDQVQQDLAQALNSPFTSGANPGEGSRSGPIRTCSTPSSRSPT